MFVAQEITRTEVEITDYTERTDEDLGDLISHFMEEYSSPIHVFATEEDMQEWCQYYGFEMVYITDGEED